MSGRCSSRALHALMRSERDNVTAGCQRRIDYRDERSWAKAQTWQRLGWK